MPRLTRSSLTESAEPTRRSSRAATQASSTSSKSSPRPGRSRSVKKGGDTGDGDSVDKPEDDPVVEETEKTPRGGRTGSRSRGSASASQSPSPAPKGRGKSGARGGKKKVTPRKNATLVPVEDPEADASENQEEETSVEDVAVPETDTKGSRSRSRGRQKTEDKPAVTPSPTSRGRRSRGTPDGPAAPATVTPPKQSPRRGRGRKSDPEPDPVQPEAEPEESVTGVESLPDSETTSSAEPQTEAKPVTETKSGSEATPETTAVSESTSSVAEEVPSKKASDNPPEDTTLSTPVVEPITPESDTEQPVCAPAVEDISPMETEPSKPIPEASEPVTTGVKRPREEELQEDEESSAKRVCQNPDEQTNEAVPVQEEDVEMKDDSQAAAPPEETSQPSTSVPEPAQTSEAEAKKETEDFVIVSHQDVPAPDSQEVQLALPIVRQSQPEVSKAESAGSVQPATTTSEVSTSEAVSNQAESVTTNVTSVESAVSSQSEDGGMDFTHNPMVEDVSPVESSVDSNIGSYGDDRDAIAPKASAADSNVSESSETSQSMNTDSSTNEAIANNTHKTVNAISKVNTNQSEAVTSSQNSNGVSEIASSNIKTLEPKTNPTREYLSSVSKDIFHRHYLANPEISGSVDTSRQFSIVSYNLLADCHLRRGDYNSRIKEDYLDQTYRHKLLLQELEYLNGDVLCLQEVNPQYFTNILKPDLVRLGYSGDMTKRCQDYFDEGEATLYKTDRFKLIEQTGYYLKDLAEKEIASGGLSEDVQTAAREYLNRSDVLHVSKLQCLRSGKQLTVGNIHVVWDKLESNDVQCIQIATSVKELVLKAGNDTSPFILCGDFNNESTSAGYQLARDGYLSHSNIQKLQALEKLDTTEGKKSLVNNLWRAFQHTASNLKSSYHTVQGQEPEITSYVHKPQSLDYIFYNGNSINVLGCLQVVHADVLTQTGGLPTQHFPSDHMSLKSVFMLKE